MARVFERREVILLTLAFESFLGRFKICHARNDFFALLHAAVVFPDHAHPFLSRVQNVLASEIGARIGILRCRIVIVDKKAELERPSQYGKPAKKSAGAPAVAKPGKVVEVAWKNDEAKEPVGKVA